MMNLYQMFAINNKMEAFLRLQYSKTKLPIKLGVS